MRKWLFIGLLFVSTLVSAQIKTTFHIGSNGSDVLVGANFFNPIDGEKFVSYDFQFVQRQKRQFFQNNIGVAFDINSVILTSSVLIGVEINKPKDAPLNNVGIAMALRCNFWKQFGIESKLEQSKDTNLYFSLTYSLK